MGTKNHTGKFIFLMVIFFCCLLIGCNDSDSDSDKSKSIDTESTWYRDSDGDGYGDSSVSVTQENQPAGYVADDSDCADYDADIFPGAPEFCDGKDNNCDGNVDENACGPDSQKISGRIGNFNEAQAYINDDSYLQLVLYPVDGQPAFSIDAEGRRIYSSDLARVVMPDDGLFLFETSGLISGEYVIAAQALTPYDPESEVMPILADEDGQPVIFSVSADNAQILDVDLGNVRLPVPAVGVYLLPTPLQTKLSTPSGVSATDGAYEDKIRVTWISSAEADTYEVFRADSFTGQKVKVKTTTAAVYEDRSLPCGVDYYYWVKAVNTFGASDLFYSDLGFIRCPVPVETTVDGNDADDFGDSIEEPEDRAVTLSTPFGVSASDGDYADKIRITWSAVSGAAAYDVYRCETCCGAKIKIGTSNTPAYDDFDVMAGDYYYWIKATDVTGTSEFSMPDTGRIMILPPIPTRVSASDGNHLNQVLIKWSKVSTASKYEIYRAKWLGAPKTFIGETSAVQFYDTDQKCSTHIPATFVYSVKALNAAGISDFSKEDSGYVYRTLRDPVWIRASEGITNCVEITWNTVPGAKKYELYRADVVEGKKVKLVTVNHPSNIYLDSTVTSSKNYYYWVKSIDARGYTSCEFGNYDIGYCVSE